MLGSRVHKYIPYVEQKLIQLEKVIEVRDTKHLDNFMTFFIYTFMEKTLKFYAIKSEYLTFGILLSNTVIWNLSTTKTCNYIYFKEKENDNLNETAKKIIQLDTFFNTDDVEKLLFSTQEIDSNWSVLLNEYKFQIDAIRINQLYIDRHQTPVFINELLPAQIQQMIDTYTEQEKWQINLGYIVLGLNPATEKYYLDFWQSMIKRDETGDYIFYVDEYSKAKFKNYYIREIESLNEGEYRIVDYVGECFPPRFGEHIFGSFTKFKTAFATKERFKRKPWKKTVFYTVNQSYFEKDLNILRDMHDYDLSSSENIKNYILASLERPTGYALAYFVEYELNMLYEQFCYNHQNSEDLYIHFNDAEFAKKFRQYLSRLEELWCWNDILQDDLWCFYLMVISLEPYQESLELKPVLSASTQQIISILYA